VLGINLLKSLPPAVIFRLFFWVLPIFLFVRFLVGTVFGVFLLSAALYYFNSSFGDTRPLTFGQLLLWIDGLPTESKTGVLTTLLTVAGFLVAFHTATINWKAEALAHLKASVAGEIEVFFNEASRLTVDAQIYVESLIDTVNKIQNHDANSTFNVWSKQEKSTAFLRTRERLAAMSIEVHRLTGSTHLVMSTSWGATKALEDCATAFTEITEKMWVRVPNIPAGNPNPVSEFIRQVNVAECSSFIECCERNYGLINANVGAIRGSLLSSLVGFNFSALMSVKGKPSLFLEAMAKIQGQPKDVG
jgi:hypothetical protein